MYYVLYKKVLRNLAQSVSEVELQLNLNIAYKASF